MSVLLVVVLNVCNVAAAVVVRVLQLLLLLVGCVAGGAAAAIAVDLRLRLAAMRMPMRMQIGHAVVIPIQAVEGLQIVRIDLRAVVTASAGLAVAVAVFAVERVVGACIQVLQVCHVVAEMLVLGVVLLLALLAAVFHGQRRRLLLCIGRSSVCVAAARLEAAVAAVHGEAVAVAVAVAVTVVAAVADVALRFDRYKCVGQRGQWWCACGRGYGGCRR